MIDWARYMGLSFVSVGTRVLSGTAVVLAQARILGPVIAGQFAFVTAAGMMAAMLTDCGMSLRALRIIPNSPDQAPEVIRDDLRLRILLAIPYAVIAAIIIIIYAPPHGALAYGIVFLALLFNAAADYFSAVLRALGRFGLEAKTALLTNGLHALISIGGMILWPDLLGLAVSYSFSRCISMALMLWACRGISLNQRRTNVRPRTRRRLTFMAALPYGQDVLINNGMAQLDMIMAGSLLTGVAVGLYGLANRLFSIGNQTTGAVSNVFIPRLSAVAHDRKAFLQNYTVPICLLGFLGIVGCAGFAFIAPAVQQSILGHRYQGMRELWPLVGCGFLFRCLAAATAIPITASGEQKRRVFAQLVGVTFLAAGGYLATERWGAKGLLVGGCLCYGAIVAVQSFFLRRSKLIPTWSLFAVFGAIAFGTGAALVFG